MARKALWRAVLAVTGGLRVSGTAALPGGPCVIVANHCSHADTAALLAALPARRRPVVAAAADYWFRGGFRARICRTLCAAFPVRRGGGGSGDLAAASRLLAAGHDVIVYPEGTRSRDGQTGEFHRGAARLAAAAGVPLVPVGISGTRTLLPPGGIAHRPRRAVVTVRIGAPLTVALPASIGAARTHTGTAPTLCGGNSLGSGDGVSDATAEARVQVVALVIGRVGDSGLGAVPCDSVMAESVLDGCGPAGCGPAGCGPRDSGWRVRVARFAGSRRALVLVPAWAFGEALSWPLLPEPILAVLCVAVPKAGPRLAAAAALGSVAGGAAGYLLAVRVAAAGQFLMSQAADSFSKSGMQQLLDPLWQEVTSELAKAESTVRTALGLTRETWGQIAADAEDARPAVEFDGADLAMRATCWP